MSVDKFETIADHLQVINQSDEVMAALPGEIAKFAGITSSTRRVLDVGCGDGFIIQAIRAQTPTLEHAVGVDSSPAMIKLGESSESNVDLITADMHDMPLESAYFDVAFARFAVHYSRDLEAVMSEIARVVAPGGTFVIIDSHPIYGMFVKPSRDYGLKEDAHFPSWQDRSIDIVHPCFTLAEYSTAFANTGWQIEEIREVFGRRALDFEPFRIPTAIFFKLRNGR